MWIKQILLSLIASCALATDFPTVDSWDMRYTPQYTGVAQEVVSYETAYIILAASHGIKFTHFVSIGMANIKLKDQKDKKMSIVGLCNYGWGFREIDLDINFWNESTPNVQQALVFHELTHCLCGRDHDWGNGTKYEKENSPDKAQKIQNLDFSKETPENGYMTDGCPMSIMHPTILSDECMEKHAQVYLNEMFNRCDPY